MPAKNSIKTYVEDGYYHIYNRGVEKRTIFETPKDYKVFLSYLKEYLSPPPKLEALIQPFTFKGGTFKGIPYQCNNYHHEIELICYCLMPNHFHFLIHQRPKDAIDRFMQSLLGRYTIYFNKQHERVGKLFQGVYKGALVTDDAYLLHLSRYIHLNPSEFTTDLASAYSSYADFLGRRNTPWVKPKIILDEFKTPLNILPTAKITTYQDFVESSRIDSTSFLEDLTLEQD